ncbi:hypothetical protein [Agrobacterium vitis]|uniref:hypothetical protein n=1 Tax=Agrobacterium vitis TaxID=373 RepID=UPI002035CB61|nr:hypothetical protein [Agrobacterium vitis]MCM2452226.1 hypothetical protein [Agrobacterium vitis]
MDDFDGSGGFDFCHQNLNFMIQISNANIPVPRLLRLDFALQFRDLSGAIIQVGFADPGEKGAGLPGFSSDQSPETARRHPGPTGLFLERPTLVSPSLDAALEKLSLVSPYLVIQTECIYC